MERGQRKLFRKETGYIIRGLIWYFLVMILIAMGSTAVFLRGGMNRGEAEGTGYIIGVAAGVAVLFVRNILFGKKTDVFAETGKRMRFRTFAVFFCLILMMQFLFITGTWVIESVLNAAGLTMETAVSHAAGEEHTGISMLLYSGIAGPVAEEIVHRGMVLKGLRKNGKAFALILSSLLFGLGHINPVQICLAVPMGVLLGYIAVEYSVKWAILLHIANNLLLGNLFVRLLDQMPEILSDLVFFGCLTAGSVAGIIALVKNRGKLKSWFAENAAPKGYLRCAFTLPSVLILCVADLLMGVGWMVTMIAPL